MNKSESIFFEVRWTDAQLIQMNCPAICYSGFFGIFYEGRQNRNTLSGVVSQCGLLWLHLVSTPRAVGRCFWNKLQQRSWNTLHFWRSESRETGAKKTDKITIGKTYFPINQVGVLTSLTAKNPGDQKYPGCTSWKMIPRKRTAP
jgi:hypothetical protein